MKSKSFFLIVYIVMAFGLMIGCAEKVVTTEVQYVEVTDSARVVQLQHELQAARDSIKVYQTDTIMSADEFEIRYKLERIRFYNKLAGKSNNIRYLRGWINRVLEE